MAAALATRRIVVGVDASPESLHALHWAVREAALLGDTVEVVHAWSVPAVVYPEGQILDREQFRDLAQRTLDRAMASLGHPSVLKADVVPRLVEMPPVEALLEAAVGADLLAVGNRGLVALAELLVHSVSGSCTQRASCPVVVVPAHALRDLRRNRLVVGIDGSPAAAVALQWAVAEAARRRAKLSVVMTYHRHQLESPIGPPGVVDHDATRKASEALAEEMVAEALAAAPDHPRPVEVTVVPGGAGHYLAAAASTADLLVVGSRGLGSVRGALFGSVSRYCVHHSPCPVVVVPHSHVHAGEEAVPATTADLGQATVVE
jgi:nucleotide-binding universal stress UspA family protein